MSGGSETWRQWSQTTSINPPPPCTPSAMRSPTRSSRKASPSTDNVAMGRYVNANADNLVSELRNALERGDTAAFRAKAKVMLDFAGDRIFEFRLLHHHAAGFHDAKLTLKRSGLLYEPLGPCQWKAEFLPWDRISKTDIVRQGATGALLLVEVAAGKNFDKRVPLNFSVVGSWIGQESETKPITPLRL